jgi:hypothetical protein
MDPNTLESTQEQIDFDNDNDYLFQQNNTNQPRSLQQFAFIYSYFFLISSFELIVM